tara:strand:- start:168 stop:785 length:618 start_codon:yes stop_codon:yes gene_type:complete
LFKDPHQLDREMRIRDRWSKQGRTPSLEDNAVALAYVCWQVALSSTKNLHEQAFDYRHDQQRVAVIQEYLAFLVHSCDRLASESMTSGERKVFLDRLAGECARHLQRNTEDVLGPGNYSSPFIDIINARNRVYAQCTFERGEPGYALLRAFGDQIQQLMGQDQTNRWVIDQVIDIDSQESFAQIKRSMQNILDTATRTNQTPNST